MRTQYALRYSSPHAPVARFHECTYFLRDPASQDGQPPIALDPVTLPSLPCYPCPYHASCCAYGTSLSDQEAATIEANHGPGVVYFTRSREWRTRVRNKRCVLFRDGGCSIHDKPYYPTTCQGFPWVDGDTGEPYEYDQTICGEIAAHPELIEIQRQPIQATLSER